MVQEEIQKSREKVQQEMEQLRMQMGRRVRHLEESSAVLSGLE